MTEYINRSALLEKLHAAGGCDADPDTWAAGYDAGIDLAIDILRKEPAADVVEVVRCGKCKHLMFSDSYGECSRGYMGIVSPNDYCSYGERRD